MGIEIEYPLVYANTGDSLFRDTGTYYLVGLPAPIFFKKPCVYYVFQVFKERTANCIMTSRHGSLNWRICIHKNYLISKDAVLKKKNGTLLRSGEIPI